MKRLLSSISVAAALLPMALLATAFLPELASPAGAADLKVISAGAVRGLISQIIDDYSRQTGQKFDFTIGTTGQRGFFVDATGVIRFTTDGTAPTNQSTPLQ